MVSLPPWLGGVAVVSFPPCLGGGGGGGGGGGWDISPPWQAKGKMCRPKKTVFDLHEHIRLCTGRWAELVALFEKNSKGIFLYLES